MKAPIPLEEAVVASGPILEELRETNRFQHVEYAGSVRRLKEQVGDVEVVAQPRPGEVFALENDIVGALTRAKVARAPRDAKGRASPWGPRYYRGVFHSGLRPEVDLQLDLFVVLPPAEWGPIFLVRTGSAEFSQAVVTRLHRFGLHMEGGRVLDSKPGAPASRACPDEWALFQLAHLPFIDPSRRSLEIEETRALFA